LHKKILDEYVRTVFSTQHRLSETVLQKKFLLVDACIVVALIGIQKHIHIEFSAINFQKKFHDVDENFISMDFMNSYLRPDCYTVRLFNLTSKDFYLSHRLSSILLLRRTGGLLLQRKGIPFGYPFCV